MTSRALLLFDDRDRSSDDAGPALHAEPHFEYLNRSARSDVANVRALLQQWFGAYPEKHRFELRSRFRSRRDNQHHSAFFELYLHALLTSLGYELRVHPETPSLKASRPDFEVNSARGSFYLEARALSEASRNPGQAALISRAYDALNQLESPDFFLHVVVRGAPKSAVPEKKLRAVVLNYLESLDPDACDEVLRGGGAIRDLPNVNFVHDGLRLTFYPIPKKPSARGKPGIRPLGMYSTGSAYAVTHKDDLKRALRKKVARYGELEKPYVVAVNFVAGHPDDFHALDALLGQERFLLQGDQVVPAERARDGVWFGRSGPTNTRLSAVMVLPDLNPWSVAARIPRVYHNPWAEHPITQEFAAFPSYVVGDGELKLRQGDQVAPLFGLPQGWPK